MVHLTGDEPRTLQLHDWTLVLQDAGGMSHAWDKHYVFTGFTELLGPNNWDIDFSQAPPAWVAFTNPADLMIGLDDGGLYLTGLATVPEPGTMGLLALGGLALAGLTRRRKRRA
jgi:hypothetical protein